MALFKTLKTLFGSPIAQRDVKRLPSVPQGWTTAEIIIGHKLVRKPAKVVVPSSATPVQVVDKDYGVPKWFCEKKFINKPSPAEQKIIDILLEYNIKFYTEVCFEGFVTPIGGHYRFDFYIPSLNLVLEYDGKLWHSDYERKLVDTIKDTFCKTHNITIKRYSSEHYYNLDSHIDNLMRKYKVVKLKRTPKSVQ